MSVETRSSGTTINRGPSLNAAQSRASSFGAERSLGTTNYKPRVSISKEGNMSKIHSSTISPPRAEGQASIKGLTRYHATEGSISRDTFMKYSPKDLRTVASGNSERSISKGGPSTRQESVFLYRRNSHNNNSISLLKGAEFQSDRKVEGFKKSEYAPLYQRPAELPRVPAVEMKETQLHSQPVQVPEKKQIPTIQQVESKPVSELKIKAEEGKPSRRITVNPQVKSSWLNREANYVHQKAVTVPTPEAAAKTKELASSLKTKEATKSPFLKTQAKRVQQKAQLKITLQEAKALAPQSKNDLEQKASQLKEQRDVTPQAVVHEVSQNYMTTLAPETLAKRMSVENITQPTTEGRASANTSQQMSPENAKLEIVTKLHNAAKVQHNLQSILQDRGMTEVEAKQASMQQTLRVVHQTFTEKGLLEQAVGTNTQTETTTQPLTQTELELKTQLQTLDDLSQAHSITQAQAEQTIEAVGQAKTVSKQVKIVNGEYVIETETLEAERDYEADAQRIATAVAIGDDALTTAREHGEEGITAAVVATRMPTGPGERMASFIRKQLGLSLNSEQQYNEFKKRLSEQKGILPRREEVALAGQAAADEAPAVKLVRKVSKEKVRPIDHIRAVSDAEAAFLAA